MSHACQVSANPCRILDVGRKAVRIVGPGTVEPIYLEGVLWTRGCGSILHSPPLTGKRPESWGSIPQLSHFWKPSTFKLLTDSWPHLPAFLYHCTSMKPANPSSYFDQSPLRCRRVRGGEESGFQGWDSLESSQLCLLREGKAACMPPSKPWDGGRRWVAGAEHWLWIYLQLQHPALALPCRSCSEGIDLGSTGSTGPLSEAHAAESLHADKSAQPNSTTGGFLLEVCW